MKIELERRVLKHPSRTGSTLYLGFRRIADPRKVTPHGQLLSEWALAFIDLDERFSGRVIEESALASKGLLTIHRDRQTTPQAYVGAWNKARYKAIDLARYLGQHKLSIELSGVCAAVDEMVEDGEGHVRDCLDRLLAHPGVTRIRRPGCRSEDHLRLVIEPRGHEAMLDDLIVLLACLDPGAAKGRDSNIALLEYLHHQQMAA